LAALQAMMATRPDLPVVVRTTGPLPPAARKLDAILPTTSVAGQVAILRRAARRSAEVGS
jgi:hypothetical protein